RRVGARALAGIRGGKRGVRYRRHCAASGPMEISDEPGGNGDVIPLVRQHAANADVGATGGAAARDAGVRSRRAAAARDRATDARREAGMYVEVYSFRYGAA